MTSRRAIGILLAIVALQGALIVTAMRRTSTTFDEITMIGPGARGWMTGTFEMVPEHPPLAQQLYGLPVYLSSPRFPDESRVTDEQRRQTRFRYDYASQLLWHEGNDGEELAFRARLPAAAMAMLLPVVVFLFARSRAGDPAALLAAALVAFLPDILGHGGVAYNDVPLALAAFLATWALDRAARSPSPGAGATAGLACALALGFKNSAIVLAPIGVALAAIELASRRGGRGAMARCAGAALVTTWAGLVLAYHGDLALAAWRWAMAFTFGLVSQGVRAPTYLLGQARTEGFWYYFPVAFVFKTPAAFHALIVVALASLRSARLSSLATHPLRAPALAGIVFTSAVIASRLGIGFRHAMPILPFLCVLVAAGVVATWRRSRRAARAGIALLVAWAIASPISWHPGYLAFTSEYVPDRDAGWKVLADSSLDWGQGLVELREWMRREGVDRVGLAYFGSAHPEGYGVEYVPLPSYFALPPPSREWAAPPEYVVISATCLSSAYFPSGRYVPFQEREPVAVLGHVLYVYRASSRLVERRDVRDPASR